jgi:hypothetical protein
MSRAADSVFAVSVQTKYLVSLFSLNLCLPFLNKQGNTDDVHFRTTGNLSGFRSIDSFRCWLQRKQKKADVYLQVNLNNK